MSLAFITVNCIWGPDAAAEDGTVVDCTAEEGTAELSKKGGRYGGIA